MHLENSVKLDFKDVLIRPNDSAVGHGGPLGTAAPTPGAASVL